MKHSSWQEGQLVNIRVWTSFASAIFTLGADASPSIPSIVLLAVDGGTRIFCPHLGQRPLRPAASEFTSTRAEQMGHRKRNTGPPWKDDAKGSIATQNYLHNDRRIPLTIAIRLTNLYKYSKTHAKGTVSEGPFIHHR